MPPASRLTEFLTRKRVFFKTEFLFPPSVGNQDNLLMGRTVWSRLSTGRKPRSLPWGSFLLGGRVALPQCSLVKTLHWIWSKGRLDFGPRGGWGGFTSVHEKIFQNRIVRQGRGARGWRECENVERALLCLQRGRETKILREYEILQISIHHEIKPYQ